MRTAAGDPEPGKVPGFPPRRVSVHVLVDYLFFLFAGLSAAWLAWLLLTESFAWGWLQIAFFVLFWVLLAYLVLPRIHRILTAIYVPGYFIGRARTSDGLLGDPINLALLGSPAQLTTAMENAGWIRADPVTVRSSWRIVRSTLMRRSYHEAPVSPLLLFDRQQDVAYQQEVAGNPAKRHHVRFWQCPDEWLLPGGYRVDWLAAGTFDRRVGLSLFTLQVTHKIDADIDIERDHIVSSLTASDGGVSVRVIEDFAAGYHSRNGGGDAIVTDGDLPIVDLSRVTVSADAAAEPVLEDASRKRPPPVWIGTALMLLRVLAGVLSLVMIALGWDTFVESNPIELAGMTPGQVASLSGAVYAGLVGVIVAAILFYLVLALFIFRGRNWARLTAMALSAAVVISSGLDYFVNGVEISLRANLVGVPLDILVLLALSSQRAREWSRLLTPPTGSRRPPAPPPASPRP